MSDANSRKLSEVFCASLGIKADAVVDTLRYNSIPQWDSIGHMALIAALEDAFDVMLETDDIIDMSSVAKAKDILGTKGVRFE